MQVLRFTFFLITLASVTSIGLAQVLSPDQFKQGVQIKSQQQNKLLNQQVTNALGQGGRPANNNQSTDSTTSAPQAPTPTPAPAPTETDSTTNTQQQPTTVNTPTSTNSTAGTPTQTPSAPYTGFGTGTGTGTGTSGSAPSTTNQPSSPQWNIGY